MAVIILFLTYVYPTLMGAETVFWISLFIVFYTYAGYPLLLLVLVFIKKIINPASNNIPASALQPVSLVVVAYNEVAIIEEKIKNTLSLNYPRELLKFIFITDGSNDQSLSIIKNYREISHFHEPERKGKVAAMNRAMKFVTTDIVIFSDANTLLNKDCIINIMKHYSDDKVGGVAGEKKIITSTGDGPVTVGEGSYWKYESFIKKLDSRLYTIVGAAGELFSVRSALYTSLPEEIILEDFVQSLIICNRGYVVRYESEAYAEESASLSLADEMERKIRISAGGFQAIAFLGRLLYFFRHPVLSFQYISHRVLRWTLCPPALITLFFSSWYAWHQGGHPVFGYFMVLQSIFYLMALTGWILTLNNRNPGVFYLPFYFSFMNFCVFAGFSRYLAGNQAQTWKKAQRKAKI